MELTDLPLEILGKIVDHLLDYEVERFARCYSKAVYGACYKRVRARVKKLEAAEAVWSRFEPYRDSQVMTEEKWDGWGWEADFGKFERQPPQSLEYADLNGDLAWLKPRGLVRDDAIWHSKPLSEGEEKDLRRQASQLGVTIPEAFLKFMSDYGLQCQVPFKAASWFDAGDRPQIYKCPPVVDWEQGGYMIPFARDEISDWTGVLHLDSVREAHAVLDDWGHRYSQTEAEDELVMNGHIDRADVKDAAREGLCIAPVFPAGVFIEGTDFEVWLMKQYYEEWFEYYEPKSELLSILTDAEREYIRYGFRAKGRGIGY